MAIVVPGTDTLNESVVQIYPILNEVFKEMTGLEDVQVVDTNSFIAMGQSIEKLYGGTENWLNTLTRRIGMVIDEYRPYRNRFASLAKTQMEWGAIVQKIVVDMPDATFDKTYDVGMMDGQSVDQWIINNPVVHQTFFDKEAAYTIMMTFQEKLLKRAFTNEGAMAALISQIYGKIQNKSEFIFEELGRLAIANLVGNLPDKQEFHLVTMYNAATGGTLTTDTAKYDPAFMRYANSRINLMSRKLELMSVHYNTDGYQRFTPREDQRLFMLDDFMSLLETIPEYLSIDSKYPTFAPTETVPYWQALDTDGTDIDNWDTIASIHVTDKSGADVEKTNLIGVLFDKNVVGTFRQEESVHTTPVNARARYYNTFWHYNNFWYNMTDENVVAFYLD